MVDLRSVAAACLLLAMGPCVAYGQAAPVRSASAFADSIGINTHMNATDTGPKGTSYGNVDAVAAELAMVGIRHVRDILVIGKDIAKLDTLHRKLGVTFALDYDDYTKDSGRAKMMAALANVAGHRPLLEAIEGPNEPDQFGLFYDGASGAPAVMTAQRALFDAVKSDPTLKDVPVYCTALSYPAGGGLADKLGDLSAVCDYATSHVYVENRSLGPSLPYDYIARWANFPRSFVPGRPLVITEGGWSSSPLARQGVDEATQAKYTLIYLLDAFLQGISRTYLYELSDDSADPEFKTEDSHYGLFRFDGTPKPVAKMIARLQPMLGTGDAAAGTPPAPPDVTVTGMPATGHQMLLRRADGTFILALWHESYLWNRERHMPNAPAAVPMTVRVAGPARAAQLMDIMPAEVNRTGPTTTNLKTGREWTITVPPYPVFVLLH